METAPPDIEASRRDIEARTHPPGAPTDGAADRRARRRRARWGFVIAGVLAVIAVVVIVRGRRDDEAAPSVIPSVLVGPENVAVAELDRVESGPLLSGTLQPDRRASILAEVGGPVREVHGRVGDRVAAGDLLARLGDAEIEDSYRSAQAAVQSAETAAAAAERDVERYESLEAVGAIPARDVETARTQLANARTQLAQAKAQLSSARERLDATRVRAPISGVISERRASAGDVVTTGALLFTVVDPSSMQLEATVSSQVLEQVEVGAPVRFEVRGYGQRMFEGVVERIAPAVDPATGQVRLFVSIPNPAGALVAGLFAEGTVEAVSREALVVPASAIDELGSTPTVLRLRGGATERVPVQTGIRNAASARVEIVSGFEAGDTVLAGPARHIAPGTPVEIGAPGEGIGGT